MVKNVNNFPYWFEAGTILIFLLLCFTGSAERS